MVDGPLHTQQAGASSKLPSAVPLFAQADGRIPFFLTLKEKKMLQQNETPSSLQASWVARTWQEPNSFFLIIIFIFFIFFIVVL